MVEEVRVCTRELGMWPTRVRYLLVCLTCGHRCGQQTADMCGRTHLERQGIVAVLPLEVARVEGCKVVGRVRAPPRLVYQNRIATPVHCQHTRKQHQVSGCAC